jgi:hypothetical protein
MKKIFILFLMVGVTSGFCDNNTVQIPSPLSVIPSNLSSLELLIRATQQQHEFQLALLDEIIAYQKVRDLYLQKPEDKELLFRVVKRADRVLEDIKMAKLTHLFDAEFLKELNMFARFNKKK